MTPINHTPRTDASRPRLVDVAAAAGVSRATVSRVINGTKRVDPASREAVEKAIAELHYVPNLAARSLMTRRSDMIALLVGEPNELVFTDPFFASVIGGVSAELTANGQHLILLMLQELDDVDALEAYIQGAHVDGVLAVSEHAAQHIAERVAALGTPVVISGRPLADADLPHVNCDSLSGSIMATQHLLNRGCHTIGHISGPMDMPASNDRLEGYRTALGDRYSPDLVEEGNFRLLGGASATERLLTRRPDIDGLFVGNDLMAIGALQTLDRHGLRVPDDVAVVGFDDIEQAQLSNPPLTTVRQPVTEMGHMMVRLLLQNAHGPGPGGPLEEAIMLPVELVVRESA